MTEPLAFDVVKTEGLDDDAGRWETAVRPPKEPLWRQAVRALAAVDRSDLLIVVGLALLGRGCYLLHPAAGWAVPGAIVVWHQLPQRERFFSPRPADQKFEQHIHQAADTQRRTG